MIMLFVDNIAYIMADGNYTKICYIGGMTTVLSFGISKVETLVSASYADGEVSPFVRLRKKCNHQSVGSLRHKCLEAVPSFV